MILVDSSVWIDHFHRVDDQLGVALARRQVLTHGLVIAEIMCGSMPDRARVLSLLSALPRAIEADHADVVELIELRRLHGRGLGSTDAHVLASALIGGHQLWTRDRSLAGVAATLGVGFRP